VGEVDEENAMLKKLVAKYGQPLGQLLLQKRREVESHCPSGHYPVLVRHLHLVYQTFSNFSDNSVGY
jgi:hypothetical protein